MPRACGGRYSLSIMRPARPARPAAWATSSPPLDHRLEGPSSARQIRACHSARIRRPRLRGDRRVGGARSPAIDRSRRRRSRGQPFPQQPAPGNAPLRVAQPGGCVEIARQGGHERQAVELRPGPNLEGRQLAGFAGGQSVSVDQGPPRSGNRGKATHRHFPTDGGCCGLQSGGLYPARLAAAVARTVCPSCDVTCYGRIAAFRLPQVDRATAVDGSMRLNSMVSVSPSSKVAIDKVSPSML